MLDCSQKNFMVQSLEQETNICIAGWKSKSLIAFVSLRLQNQQWKQPECDHKMFLLLVLLIQTLLLVLLSADWRSSFLLRLVT